MFEFYPKKFIQKKELLELVEQTAGEVADVIGSTMGPAGQLIMYEESYKNPYPTTTKDGVSVAKMISFGDQEKNMVSQFIIQATDKQVKETGDGTTLTTILIHEIFKQMRKLILAGYQINEVIENFKEYFVFLTTTIKANARQVTGLSDLERIANVSTNGDKELSALIAKAVHKTGKTGLVFQDISMDGKDSLEYIDGYVLDTGIVIPSTANSTQGLGYQDVYVLVTDQDIFYAQKLVHTLELIKQMHPNETIPVLCLVTPTISPEIERVLSNNAKDKDAQIKIIWVRPSSGFKPEQLKFIMEDITALSGGQFISKGSGYQIDKISELCIGRLRGITQNHTQTVIYPHKKPKDRIKYLEQLREETKDEYTKKLATESVSKIENGIAKIYVSGQTSTEIQERLDRVDDAIHACKSSLELGYVRGGGVELSLMIRMFQNEEQAYQTAMKEIITRPIRTILTNAKIYNTSSIIDSIIKEETKGYDIIEEEVIKDMYDIDIIDPAKVIIHALKNSLSVAISMLKSSYMIIHDREAIKKIKSMEG
jgi:chaperonin GroEL